MTTPRIVEPHNLIECCDALFNMTVLIRQASPERSERHEMFVKGAGRLEDMVVAHGQEVYQSRDLNDLYRTLEMRQFRVFAENMRAGLAQSRTTLHELMEWADRLCDAYVAQRPFARYHVTDETLDEQCRAAFVWVASGQERIRGYDVKDLMFVHKSRSIRK